MRAIQYWLTDDELSSIYSSAYWNDTDVEKRKFWWIADGDYSRCMKHLEVKLLPEFRDSSSYINTYPGEHIKIADLAAGIGWTSALLSKIPKVDEVHAVEISKHRLGELFEQSLRMLSGDASKIYRHLGSFYDLQFDDASIDIIYMSQAFHHADEPFKLLLECDRVLKDNGRIILVGEHYIGLPRILKRIVTSFIKHRKFTTNFYGLFPPDQVLGDHYYRVSDYYFMFGAIGYGLRHLKTSSDSVIYVAEKTGRSGHVSSAVTEEGLSTSGCQKG